MQFCGLNKIWGSFWRRTKIWEGERVEEQGRCERLGASCCSAVCRSVFHTSLSYLISLSLFLPNTWNELLSHTCIDHSVWMYLGVFWIESGGTYFWMTLLFFSRGFSLRYPEHCVLCSIRCSVFKGRDSKTLFMWSGWHSHHWLSQCSCVWLVGMLKQTQYLLNYDKRKYFNFQKMMRLFFEFTRSFDHFLLFNCNYVVGLFHTPRLNSNHEENF